MVIKLNRKCQRVISHYFQAETINTQGRRVCQGGNTLPFWTANQGKGCGRSLPGALCPLTVILPFDKALPLPKPLHADAVYDHRRILLLERLV